MSKIGVHLGADKSAWVDYAKSKGYTSSKLAALILKQILESEKIGKPIFQTESKREWGATTRIEMRLNQSELEALDAFVEHEGKTRQGFLIGLFRAYIANEPQYSIDEVLALRQSNTALRKIGANLNMIAKSFNQGNFNISELSQEIVELQKIIEQHTIQIGEALNPSIWRYKINKVG